MASKTTYRDLALFPLHQIKYPYHISTVFPAPALDSNGWFNGSRRATMSSPRKPGDGLDTEIQMLDTLRIVDYRYLRFALDPRTGLFNVIRYNIFLTLLKRIAWLIIAQRLERSILEGSPISSKWS